MKKHFLKIDNQGNIQETSENEIKKKKLKGNYLKYCSIGINLVTPILIFLFLGIMIDKWTDKKPLFTLIFIFLGAFGSLFNMYKIAVKK